MIEVSVKHLEGLNFIVDVKIVEPREKKNGVYIEYVDRRTLYESPVFKFILRAFGMRQIGEAPERHAYIYAFHPWGYWQYKMIYLLIKAYLMSLWWLYGNARIFKQIPPAEMFSWKYFTLYIWCKTLMNSFRRKIR